MIIYSDFVNTIDTTTNITNEIFNAPGELVANSLLDHSVQKNVNGHIIKEIFDVPSTSISEGCIIINVTKETIRDYFDNPELYAETIGNNSVYKVFVVHDFNKDTIPFLKLADFLIFFTETQKHAFKKLLDLKIPCKVVPYPLVYMQPAAKPKKKNQVQFFTQYDPKHNDKYTSLIESWVNGKLSDNLEMIDTEQDDAKGTIETLTLSKLNFMFDAFYLPKDAQAFNAFKKSLPILPKKVKIRGNRIKTTTHNVVAKRISRAKYVYIYNEEIDTDIARETIELGTDQILYSNLRENALLPKALAYGCKVIMADASNTENGYYRVSDERYVTRIKSILGQRLSNESPSYEIDTLDDLNIIHGEPLTNEYTFIVNFRNQEDKILRCLQSIETIASGYDVGIAIINDDSNDNSSDIVNTFISNTSLDIVYVENNERKMSSRNLFNSTRYLITNNESICIEVDGDDFLPTDKDVLSYLESEYVAGALKTVSLFESYPTPGNEIVTNNRKFDFSNPWDHGKCTPWSPLRSYKRSLINQVELEYFVERETGEWLKMADDSSINPRMIELSNGKTHVINEVLYMYDLSGQEHDSVDNWTPFYSHSRLYRPLVF